jgi:hypothetical protein
VRLVGGARAMGIEGSLQLGFALHRVHGVEDRLINHGFAATCTGCARL